jgi:tetratricopeptide (TPR) repeat protein
MLRAARLLQVLVFAALTAAASAADQARIAELYRKGLEGDQQAVIDCIRELEAALTKQPDNQLARVYLGSAYTVRSRDLGFGPKKLQTFQQGLRVMDEAVAKAPDDPKVRLGRALTTQALPGIFGRAAESRNDFLKLAEMAKTTPAKFENSDLLIVFYNAGLAAKAEGNAAQAEEFWREGLRHGNDASIKQKIEAELAKPRR